MRMHAPTLFLLLSIGSTEGAFAPTPLSIEKATSSTPTSLAMKKKTEEDMLNSLDGKSRTFVLRQKSSPSENKPGFKNPFPEMFQSKEKQTSTGVRIKEVNTMEKKRTPLSKESYLADVLGEDLANDPVVAAALADAASNTKSDVATTKTFQLTKAQDQAVEAVKKQAKKELTAAELFESSKALIVGLLSGGVAVTPVAFLHDYYFPGKTIPNGIAQWEFDTDTGSLAAALFAVIYRFSIREGEESNELLPLFVISSFVLVRTLSRVRVSYYCDAIPLNCGAPFGYFDFAMSQQALFSGLESLFLFGAAASAMDYCYKKGFISRYK